METNKPQTISYSAEIPLKRIADLLTSAFEGGSNYWISKVTKVKPVEWSFYSDPDLGRQTEGGPPKIWLADYPLNPGGKLTFRITESFDKADTRDYELDLPRIKKGIEMFLRGEGFGKDSDGTPRIVKHHAANFLSEDDDAETGDVFLQICLFGEVVFG
jgi:hypothetical protein